MTTDPAGDVLDLSGQHKDDPTRDLLRLSVALTPSSLSFDVQLVDVQDLPSQAPGDFLRVDFTLKRQQFQVDVSRRLVSTGTPHNSNYAHVRQSDAVPVTARWDPQTNTVRVSVDRAKAQTFAKSPIRLGTKLIRASAFTAPAVTDDGTPAWADFAGKPGSNNASVDYTLRTC